MDIKKLVEAIQTEINRQASLNDEYQSSVSKNHGRRPESSENEVRMRNILIDSYDNLLTEFLYR